MRKNILKHQDIINTYNPQQQEQSNLYFKYKKIKKENSNWGYKKIAKAINQPIHKTRWWHTNKHIPTPIQTINWLKEKNLTPLNEGNQIINLVSKILGTTFGDGGIFSNLNGIFFSSSEIDSIKEFEKDLELIFGKEIRKNSRIIEGGVYGHSWCYQNTNRNVIRFFQALGAPVGKKSNLEIKIPEWVITNPQLQDSFFSSFFGNEIGIPKIHKDNKRTNSLDLGLVCKKMLYKNRIIFLKQIQNYLKSKNINADKIYTRQHKEDKNSFIIKLAINLNFDNLMNLNKEINLSYSDNKQKRLVQTLNKLKEIKLQRYNQLSNTRNQLTQRNYSREWIKNNLRLTEKSLKFIMYQEILEKWY